MRLIDADELKTELTIHEAHLMDKAKHTSIESDRMMYVNTATGVIHAINILNNAPSVEYPFYREAYQTGYEEGKNERPQVNCENCDGYEAGYSAGLKDAERPQGEWICDYRYLDCKCSICNSYALERGDYPELSVYCPQCGARMKAVQFKDGGAE